MTQSLETKIKKKIPIVAIIILVFFAVILGAGLIADFFFKWEISEAILLGFGLPIIGAFIYLVKWGFPSKN